MKNVFFALAFMLVGTFAFANDVKDNEFESPSTETVQTFLENLENTGYTTVLEKVVIDDLFCIETHLVYFKGRYLGSFEVETNGVNGECGVTIHWT